ncbi:hypothetical protein SynRS9902_01225 [Synechococcus sp. RS9902]|nr:hypothetical protein SynRS9902_01225 [Synechococcus sp. RS9902]
MRWLEMTGCLAKRDLEIYFNSGFLSINYSDLDFLDLWIDLIDKYGANDVAINGKGDISDWRIGGRWNSIFSPNQDTLNMALMLFEKSIVTLGPDAMGFVEGGVRLIPHAIGKNKPWRRNFIADAFKGKPVRLVDILFWRYANYPCPAFKKGKCSYKRIELKLSKLISRIIRKT